MQFFQDALAAQNDQPQFQPHPALQHFAQRRAGLQHLARAFYLGAHHRLPQAAGVARVVYAASDPGHASGGGAERLRAAGIEVIGGVLAGEVEEFLADWLVAARLGRPHITVKWASSLDGRVAAADGTPLTFAVFALGPVSDNAKQAIDTLVTGFYKCGDNLMNG